jgi:NitT/TauT family transport system ATP-binding protein
MDNSARIRTEHVSCSFTHRKGALVHALRDVSFTVPPGQFVCLVGRSGHGKSTLLRVLAGLQRPTSGQAYIGERHITTPGSDRGMVFQQDTVFPWMHVRDNVEYGLRARGIPRAERRSISDRWLKAVGLDQFADSWPKELSGGMRKRVAFAAVLAAGADVWLMDEPFGSLDYFTRRSLHELVLGVWRHERKTVFFVTHDIEEALILADRILLLANGELVSDLEVRLPRPRDEDARASPEAVLLTKTVLQHLAVEEDGVSRGGGPDASVMLQRV